MAEVDEDGDGEEDESGLLSWIFTVRMDEFETMIPTWLSRVVGRPFKLVVQADIQHFTFTSSLFPLRILLSSFQHGSVTTSSLLRLDAGSTPITSTIARPRTSILHLLESK